MYNTLLDYFCYCFIFKKTIQMRGVEMFPFFTMLNERDSDIIYYKKKTTTE